MIRSNRTLLVVLATLVALLGPSRRGMSAVPTIVPLSVSVHFSREEADHPWSQYVMTPAGKPVYILSLRPDYAVGHRLTAVSLVLHHVGDQRDDRNLLSPPGNWHGIQPYVFSAFDLRNGVDRTVFGPIRKIAIAELSLTVIIELKRAKVSTEVRKPPEAVPPFLESYPWDKDPEVDDLWLDIKVQPAHS